MRADVKTLRRFLWHLRSGGPQQVRLWLAREALESGHRKLETVRGAEGAWIGRGKKRRLKFQPSKIKPSQDSGHQRARVGVILDDFSATAFGVEWDCIPLTPRAWQEQLEEESVDFLFVESAWKGNGGSWTGRVSGQDPTGPSILRELTTWCNERNIPTVFWNKEDPPHYDDFLAAAKLFGHVFTSDANKLEAYRRDLGHHRVEVLPFAAQPALHNPVRPKFGWHERDVAFGGMYFTEKYPERREQLDLLLTAAVSASSVMDTGLEIFSRQIDGDAKYQFPEQFSDRVVGGLDYAEMLTAYKAYKTFLNVNSVVDSPTMCSRRVFEVVASGSNLVTTPSPAIDSYFDSDELFSVKTQTEADSLLRALHKNPELGERQLHRGQRRIWRDHTYEARAAQVMEAVAPGSVHRRPRPTISALVSTIRPWQLEHVFRTIGSQTDIEVELVLLTHGFEPGSELLDQLKERFGVKRMTALTAKLSVPLGECLNMCVAAASGEILTKMDDDDFYGVHYLSDQLYALGYSGADLVGKQAHYMHLAAHNATILRFPDWEHRYTRSIMGPTIFGKAEIFRATPFAPLPGGEDTRFLNDLTESGGVIYSSDRFNYCQQRLSSGHTWKMDDAELLASGRIKYFGNYSDEVSV